MFELLFYAVHGWGRLLTFQSMTGFAQADFAFSIVLILSTAISILTFISPKWWNLTPSFLMNTGAIIAISMMMVSDHSPSGSLAALGSFMGMLEVLIVFCVYLLVTIMMILRACVQPKAKTHDAL